MTHDPKPAVTQIKLCEGCADPDDPADDSCLDCGLNHHMDCLVGWLCVWCHEDRELEEA